MGINNICCIVFIEHASPWSLHYGYMDRKAMYRAVGPVGEIHLRVKIGSNNFLWVCGGSHKESLKYSTIYFEENVVFAEERDFDLNSTRRRLKSEVSSEKRYWSKFGRMSSDGNLTVSSPTSGLKYVPSDRRIQWHHVKFVGNECKSIFGLPPGQHVISIAANATMTKHTSGVSHVIMWP